MENAASERRRQERRSNGIPKDEVEILHAYRKAKSLKYADINIAIQEGIRVKLWLTEKMK